MSVVAPDVLKSYVATKPPAYTSSISLQAKLSTEGVYSARTSTQPVDEPGTAKAGCLAPQWGNLLYDQILAIPERIDYGYLLARREDNASLWNTFRTSKTVSTITGYGMEGITLTGVNPGSVAKPLKAIAFTIIATLSGPSNINGYYEFDFGGVLVDIAITGSRTMIFPYPPRIGMIETLEWLTDVITSFDGTEGRDGARLAPRQGFEGEFQSTDRNERVRMAAILTGWLINTFSLPVWPQHRQVDSLASGATTIMLDTSYAEYRNGGFAVIRESNRKAEIVTITEVLADRLNLAYPVTRAYINPFVMPARVARISGNVSMGDTGIKAARYQLKFEVLDNREVSTGPSAVEYRGFDVLTKPCLMPGGDILERDFERDIERIDYDTGLTYIDTGMDWSRIGTRAIRTLTRTRQEAWEYRRWLQRREGRFRPFWLPTFSRDVELAQPFGAAEISLHIVNIDYTNLLYGNPQFRHLAFFRTDGTVLYRKITAAAVTDTDEIISLDTSLGFDGNMGSFEMISFMALNRLAADRVEMAWEDPDILNSEIGLMGLDDES